MSGLPAALHAIAQAQGELADLGARGDERAEVSARLLEALGDALTHFGELAVRGAPPSPPRPDVVDAIHHAALSIHFAVHGRNAAKRWARRPIALDVRRLLADMIRVGEFEATAEGLGTAIETCARLASADAIMPRDGTPEERMKRYAKAAKKVLSERRWRPKDPDLAERLIVECGVSSRLFEEKKP